MSPETKRPELLCASAVRSQFLDFFAARGHDRVASAPVFPHDDPTLLFTNAGMNQFKDVFLGTGRRSYTRAVDTQKCIRVSGKHNDLEEVGVDTYHHTFFEMLGNWSFGDYFKREAILWAWELLTKVWGLPPERLWVTVFGGDEADGLAADEEAERIWIEEAGVPAAQVLRFSRRDNFWEMGDTGPCGPCTEIHIDRGGPGTDPRDGADRLIGVNAGNERFIELWNLVFMEFNRVEGGALKPLPARHVDTGMGFERILSVLQGKRSNYDTDLFTPLFARIAALTGKAYEAGDPKVDVAFRVVADHVRAVTAAIADGASPSNTGRGYVLRRLLRRAARFGRAELGMEEPFLYEVASAVADVLGDAFPEMRQRIDHVQLVIREEESSFGRTLGRGLVQFEHLERRVRAAGALQLPGEEAYELYATYGFPKDLVEQMARERELGLDQVGWEEAERRHQDASRAEGTFKQLLSADDLARLEQSAGATRSTYHDLGAGGDQAQATLVFCAPHPVLGEGGVKLVLDASPFYPEGGGQVGDTGLIEALDGRPLRIEVQDTQRAGALVVQVGRVVEGAGDVRAFEGRRVRASVDGERRARTRKNHTATHILHRALKLVLGDHVTQQGSYVGPDRLRFDFSHPRGVSPEELEQIEALVNARICENQELATTVEDLEAARGRGVTALFGEKYDERVRVVALGEWSLELCGGTHVRAAGDIGAFLIISERAIQAGVRRLEALTGPAAILELQRQRRILRETSQLLKAKPEELVERIEKLQDQVKEARKQRQTGAGADVAALLSTLRAGVERVGGVEHAVLDAPELDGEGVRELANRARQALPEAVLVLVGREGDRAPFVVAVGPAARSRGLAAGELAKGLGRFVRGVGGGKPELAQGQGADPGGVPAALAWVRSELATRLGG
jgi:alanyl-tRNA synthetase